VIVEIYAINCNFVLYFQQVGAFSIVNYFSKILFSKFNALQDDQNMQTVLVVDDSAIDLLMMKTLLEKLGYEPSTSTNGKEALDLILENSPSFVICDINMPGMSGIELLKATRHLKQQPVFIMATNMNDAEHAVTALHLGAYGYLTKPIKEDSLRETLRKVSLRRQRELDAGEGHELSRIDTDTGLLTHREMARSIASSYGDKGAIVITVGEEGVRIGIEGLTQQQVQDALCIAIHYNFSFPDREITS
jgi:CheY-like chemotaxis protein